MEKDWNPNLYLKFEKERTLPARQLLMSINKIQANRILDIGCGPGNSTRILKENWPNADLIGIDSSSSMIENAKKSDLDVEWIIEDFNNDLAYLGNFDVIFSNAVLQWVPDHNQVIKKSFGMLKTDGVFAAQIPYILNMDIKKVTDEVAQSDKWKRYIKDLWNFYMFTPDYYYNILCKYTDKMSLWESTYYHVMDNHEEIVEWYKATGMRPYFKELPDEKLVEEFTSDVLKIIKNKYVKQSNGKVLFPFRRVFVIAYKI